MTHPLLEALLSANCQICGDRGMLPVVEITDDGIEINRELPCPFCSKDGEDDDEAEA
jgi:hypothetical protein